MKEIICKFLLFALCFCNSEAIKKRYYPTYHFPSPGGWLNDPNGLIQFKGEFHLFFQYNPLSSQSPGTAHWGHAKSMDLFHWKHLPIAMYPDEPYDRTGVFSGSAIEVDEIMYFFYTGNVNTAGGPDNRQYQALAFSEDGINVTKYTNNPLIEAKEHQPNIRDPKVWKYNDTFYMVIGNSFENNTLGRALLYASQDMIDWEEISILGESDGFLGYMWECPDLFELDGFYILLFSPQGMKPQGDKYKNLYQTGYIVGYFDYETLLFTPVTEFRELDHGRHFYATQTTLDASGRRIMFAWFDMWEDILPERNDGWTGQMTLPRELSLTGDLQLIQTPVQEIDNIIDRNLYSGKAKAGKFVQLEYNAARVKVQANRLANFELRFESLNKTSDVMIRYNYKKGHVTIYQDGQENMRRTKWRPLGKLFWSIFLDASSIELFCGEGEVTFSNRYFPEGAVTVRIGGFDAENFTVYSIKPTIEFPDFD